MSDQAREPDPDGWERFERAVDAALHTKPAHKKKAAKDFLGGQSVDPKPDRKRQPD